MSEGPQLVFDDPQRMSLLGLMLGGLVADNLERAEGAARARKLRGKLGVTAGKMSVTMIFEGGGVTVKRGLEPDLRARVRGSLDGLLQVSLGRGPIRAFLAGEVSFRGNPIFVIRVLPLMRVPDRGKGARS